MALHETLAEWSQWIWPLAANHLWLTTWFVLIVWALAGWLKPLTAPARYWIWAMALVKFLVPSSWLILVIESIGFDLWRSSAADSAALSAGARILTIVSTAGPGKHHELYCGLTLVWGLGTLACLARWLVRRGRFRSMLRERVELTRGREAEAFNRVKSQLLPHREVSLMVVSGVNELGVWRAWRPVLILPEGLAECLNDQELEAVIMHELVHVQRHDNLRSIWQMLVCSLFWFNPLIWLIDRRLLAEREMICDDAVVRYGGSARTYAAGLWKAAQFGFGWNLAGISRATGSTLLRRITLMLNAERSTRPSLLARAAAGAAVGVLFIVVTAMGVATRSEATAVRMQLQPGPNLWSFFSSDRVPDPAQAESKSSADRRSDSAKDGKTSKKSTVIYREAGAKTSGDKLPAAQNRSKRGTESKQNADSKKSGQHADDVEPMNVNLKPSITYKEKASYTQEARDHGVEGQVILNVVFSKDGTMNNIKVIQGLPDGLTDQAITAAQKIRFVPAEKDGKPVSVRGNLEFTFRLE